MHKTYVRAALAAAVFAMALPAAARAQAPVGGVVNTVGTVVNGVVAPLAPAVPVSAHASCAGARRHARARVQSAAIFCLVNRARLAHALAPLRPNAALARAAARQARDMHRRRYFGHQRAGGPALSTRARSAGWHGHRLGEAIAFGCGSFATPVRTVAAWLHSRVHRAILLGSAFGQAGLGLARAPVACSGTTYVLDAGR
jgi:uncharacterized protein YkwD